METKPTKGNIMKMTTLVCLIGIIIATCYVFGLLGFEDTIGWALIVGFLLPITTGMDER